MVDPILNLHFLRFFICVLDKKGIWVDTHHPTKNTPHPRTDTLFSALMLDRVIQVAINYTLFMVPQIVLETDQHVVPCTQPYVPHESHHVPPWGPQLQTST